MQKAYRYGIEIECIVNAQTLSELISKLEALGREYTPALTPATIRRLRQAHGVTGNDTARYPYIEHGVESYHLPNRDGYSYRRLNILNVGSDGSISIDTPRNARNSGSEEYETREEEGIEIRLGPASMRTITRIMPKITALLSDVGNARVNKSCGLHIHVSNKRFMQKKYLKRVIHTWLACEDVFMRTQPKSRQNNGYALRFLKSYFTNGFDKLPSVKERLISKCSQQHRYCVMNLSALAEHGTIENRLHSASTEAGKIIRWAKLLTAFYDYCLSENYSAETVNALLKQSASADKVNAFFDLLALDIPLRKYYAERIGRFDYPYLETQQKALNDLLVKQPELERMRRRYQNMRHAYDTVNASFEATMQMLGRS